MRTDLHTHTTFSDGLDTPTALVVRAHEQGVGLLAVTDHDTLDGLPEAARVALALGVGLVAGIELSVPQADGFEVHLLAYGVNPDHAPLRAHLDGYRAVRADRGRAIVERLNALGVPVDYEAVRRRAGQGVIARPHVAAEIVAVGAAPDVAAAFQRYLHDGAPAVAAKPALELREAVRLVHAAGGLAVVAHPGLLPTDAALDRCLAAGVDGLEVEHPTHNWATVRLLAEECRRRALLAFGGSDYHGRPADLARFGRYGVPDETLDALRPHRLA